MFCLAIRLIDIFRKNAGIVLELLIRATPAMTCKCNGVNSKEFSHSNASSCWSTDKMNVMRVPILFVIGISCIFLKKSKHLRGCHLEWTAVEQRQTMENRYARIDAELQRAAANGNLEIVETLLSQGVKCNARNDFGWTPLMQAANFGHAQVVATLIARGADVNQCNDLGASIVAVACTRNDAKILRLLLESNVSIAATDEVSPLAVAVTYGHGDMIEPLLDHGYLPNCVAPYSGVTPLHLATINLHIRSVCKLLARGADALRRDAAAGSLLDLVTSHPWSKDVATRGDLCLLKELRELLHRNLKLDLRVGWAEDVLECSDSGESDKMTKLLSELASDLATLELRQQAHALTLNTALLQAATHGHQEIAALLVTFGADVNTVRADGRTPLMLAAANGHVVVSRLLLDGGANVFARCPITGHTAFELASLEDHVPNELLRLLAQRTLSAGPHHILPWTLEEQPAEPRTPQTYPKKTFLFPPSMKKAPRSLPGSPNYQKDVMKFDWPYSPKKVTPADLMAQLAKGSAPAPGPPTTPQKVKRWISRVSNKFTKPN